MAKHPKVQRQPVVLHVPYCFYCDFISASVCSIAADTHVAMTTFYTPLRASLCSVQAAIQRAALQSGGWVPCRDGSQTRRRSDMNFHEVTTSQNPFKYLQATDPSLRLTLECVTSPRGNFHVLCCHQKQKLTKRPRAGVRLLNAGLNSRWTKSSRSIELLKRRPAWPCLTCQGHLYI